MNQQFSPASLSAGMESVGVHIDGVDLSYGSHRVLKNIHLDIKPGEFFAFLGPSGCGKTTLLRLIAGFNMAQRGQVTIGGRDISALPPHKRDVGMVFQSYALWPHMTVRRNVAFGLEERRVARAEIERRVDAALDLVGLKHLADRRPSQLSGGQRQRVAIGRAIVREPSAFLFDEPLSNLDAALRGTMRLEISELHNELNTTMIYVTHDQVEAMTMADKIVVLNRGNIEQVGSPLDLYSRPRNLFVAGFIGSPRMNLIEGDFARGKGARTVGIRPEHLALSKENGLWNGTVKVAEHLGSDTFLHVDVPGIGQINARCDGEFGARHGETVYLTPNEAKLHRFDEEGLAI